MKLRNFARAVKQTRRLHICHVARGDVWLAHGKAIYRAAGLPKSVDSETILPVLDFDAEESKKIVVISDYFDDRRDVFGMDLRDDRTLDIPARRITVSAVKNGVYATGLLCDDGELVFYSSELLSPLADVYKEHQEYIEIVVRAEENGQRYIVVRDGFDVVAAILPLNIIDKEFLGDLQEFQARCVEQYLRLEARRGIADMDDGQTVIEGTEGGGNDD